MAIVDLSKPNRETRWPNNGQPLKTKIAKDFPTLSRRERREVERGLLKLAKKETWLKTTQNS